MTSTGFPDFITYKRKRGVYYVEFVECKVNGKLSKEEEQKAKWYLKNNYCSVFLVAYKEKKGRKIIIKYKDVLL